MLPHTSFSATLKSTRAGCRDGHCCLPRTTSPFPFPQSLSKVCFSMLFLSSPQFNSTSSETLFLRMPTSDPHSIPTFCPHPTSFLLFQWRPDDVGLDFDIVIYCQDLFESQFSYLGMGAGRGTEIKYLQ